MKALTSAIVRYCQQRRNYSVLLNGRWGSGKTYYCNTVLRRENLGAIAHVAYVSLYGVSTIQQLHWRFLEAFVAKKDPLLDAGKAIAKWFGGAFKVDPELAVSLLDTSRTLVILDDVERSTIDVTEVFGFANSLVEHRYGHVLLVCDEAELRTKWKHYDRTKEKVVGFTYEFSQDPLSLVDGLIGESAVDAKWATRTSEFLRKLIAVSKTAPNLRTLQRVVDTWADVVQTLPKDLPTSSSTSELVFSVIFGLLSVTREDERAWTALEPAFREGFSFLGHYMRRTQERKKKGGAAEGDDEDLIDLFQRMYTGSSGENAFVLRSVFIRCRNGILDEHQFRREFGQLYSVEQGVPQPSEQLFLNNHWQLEDGELRATAAIFLERLRADQIGTLGEMQRLAPILYFLARDRLIESSVGEVDQIFRGAIDRRVKAGATASESLSDFVAVDASDLRLFTRLRKVLSKITSANRKLNQMCERAFMRKMFAGRGSEEVRMLVNTMSSKGEYSHTPVLSHVPLIEVLSWVDALDKEGMLNFYRLLKSRYGYANPGDFVAAERARLVQIRRALRARKVGDPRTLREHFMVLAVKEIDKVLPRLVSQKKPKRSRS